METPQPTTATPGRVRTPCLLNKSEVRLYAEGVMRRDRPALADKFTRVSESFYETIEAQLKTIIANRINAHPSTGKTLT